MPLIVQVVVQAQLPDGETTVAQVMRSELSYSPGVDDSATDARLASQAAERLATEAVSQLEERLLDWGRAIDRIVAEEGEG